MRTGSWAGYSSSCFHVLSVLPRQTGQGLHCRCRAGLHVAGPHLAAARLDTHSARQLAGNPYAAASVAGRLHHMHSTLGKEDLEE